MRDAIEKWHELDRLIAESMAIPDIEVDELERLHRRHLEAERSEIEQRLMDGVARVSNSVLKRLSTRRDETQLRAETARRREIQNKRRRFLRDAAKPISGTRWKECDSVIEDVPTEYPIEVVERLPTEQAISVLSGEMSQIASTMVVRNYHTLGYKVGTRSSRRYEGFRWSRR